MVGLVRAEGDQPRSAARVGIANGLLFPAERGLVGAVAMVAVASVLVAILRGQAVDWAGFLPGLAPGAFLFVTGLYARQRRSSERLALYMISLAIFLSFIVTASIFTFLMFPMSHPLIDHQLIAVDHMLGYSWPDFVRFIAGFPAFGKLLGVIYSSSIWQLFLVISVLAWLHRTSEMHRFLLVGVIGLTITVAIWWLFPSIGPSAYFAIPADVAARINLVVTPAEGAKLLALTAQGTPVITPEVITGTIAFPSFHMMMACIVVWFARTTPVAIPMAILNALMIPATLSHGGHHLIDLIGGVAIFGLALWISMRLVPGRDLPQRPRQQRPIG